MVSALLYCLGCTARTPLEVAGTPEGPKPVEVTDSCDDAPNCPEVCAGDTCVEPAPICGDGSVDAGEDCDDGSVDSATCDYAEGSGLHACSAPACGDDYVNIAAGEQCDDGAHYLGDGCDAACLQEVGLVFGSSAVLHGAATDTDARVAGDGNGNWLIVWSADLRSTDRTNCDFDILLSRSTDNGLTWSASAALNTNASSDAGDDANPMIAADGSGNWVAVWSSSDDLEGTIGGDDDLLVSTSADVGRTWSAPAPLYASAMVDSTDEASGYVVTDRQGNWIILWSSSDTLGGAVGSDADILISRSTNAGASWSSPTFLNSNAPTDVGSDSSAQLAADGQGNWVAVWSSNEDLSGSLGTDTDILVSASTDGGHVWSAPASLKTTAASENRLDKTPAISTDGLGSWVVVWGSTDSLDSTIGGDYDILVATSTDVGVSWAAATPLNSYAASDFGGHHDQFPQVGTDTRGRWIAVWSSPSDLVGVGGLGSTPRFSTSVDAGISWLPAQTLYPTVTAAGTRANYPRVGVDGAGHALAVWRAIDPAEGFLGRDWEIVASASADSGVSWSEPGLVNSDGSEDSGRSGGAHIHADSSGTLVALWSSTDNLRGTTGADNDILISTSNDQGQTWDTPAPVNSRAPSDSGNDHRPRIAENGLGHWMVAWVSDDDMSGTIGADMDILISTSMDSGNSWSAQKFLNSNAPTDLGDDVDVDIATDGLGTWVAVWASTENQGGATGSDSDILYSISNDIGVTWSPPLPLNSNAAADGGTDSAPRLATDRLGNWLVVWQSDDSLAGSSGADADIFVATSSDAALSWSSVELLNTNATLDTGDDRGPEIVTNGTGLWLAVWCSNDTLGGTIGPDDDVLFSMSSDDGASWTLTGALNSNAFADTGRDQHVTVDVDSSGNFVAVWVSNDAFGGPAGSDDDILVSTSTDSGLSWSSPELLNANAESDGIIANEASPSVTAAQFNRWAAIWELHGNIVTAPGGVYSAR